MDVLDDSQRECEPALPEDLSVTPLQPFGMLLDLLGGHMALECCWDSPPPPPSPPP